MYFYGLLCEFNVQHRHDKLKYFNDFILSAFENLFIARFRNRFRAQTFDCFCAKFS